MLDTNVLSETRKHRGNAGVLEFLRQASPDHIYISVLTMGELRKGADIYKTRHAGSASGLDTWIDAVESDYASRILDVDRHVAQLWGHLSATRTRSIIDTLLAATAIHHGLTFVTRNVRDVEDTPVVLHNPWSER